MSELVAENVTKTFKDKVILDNISVRFGSGKIYGIAGENGSGKTMFLRALSGLMRPSDGKVTYDGKVLYDDISFLPSLGIIIENAGLYPEFTAKKNLEYLASVKKIIGNEEIENALRRVGLDPADKRTVKKYSLGMKKKLMIAQAVMERPDVLLLDEVTSALDEESVKTVRQLITEEKERGALIVISSHNKEDLELLCDEIYSMASGKLTLKEGASS